MLEFTECKSTNNYLNDSSIQIVASGIGLSRIISLNHKNEQKILDKLTLQEEKCFNKNILLELLYSQKW